MAIRQCDGFGKDGYCTVSLSLVDALPIPLTCFPPPFAVLVGAPEAVTMSVWPGQGSSAVWTSVLHFRPHGEGFFGQRKGVAYSHGGSSVGGSDALLTVEPGECRISSAVLLLTHAITGVKFGLGGCDEILF